MSRQQFSSEFATFKQPAPKPDAFEKFRAFFKKFGRRFRKGGGSTAASALLAVIVAAAHSAHATTLQAHAVHVAPRQVHLLLHSGADPAPLVVAALSHAVQSCHAHADAAHALPEA